MIAILRNQNKYHRANRFTNVLSCDVIEDFYNRSQHYDTVMEDFCDGVLYKSDEFLLRSPNALHIHMYSDEFEICNPIGPKKGKHKPVAFYTVSHL